MQVRGKRCFDFWEFGIGLVRFEEVGGEVGAGAFRRGLDDVEDVRDVRGNVLGIRAEPNRAHGGDKKNPFAVFPDMQAVLLKIGAQPVDGLGREAALFFPCGTDGVADLAVAYIAAGDAAHFQGFPGTNALFKIVRAEVGLDFLGRFEFHRFGLLNGAEDGDGADLFFPLLDDSGVVDDFNLSQEFVEVHASAEARLVEPPQGGLVAVVVGGAEQHAAQAATAHVGVVALGGLKLLGFLGVIGGLALAEGFPLGGLAVGGHRPFFAYLVERVGGGVGSDPHAMAFGLV